MSLNPRAESAAQFIAERFKLTRPLAVLDTETTGVNVEQDRIVELAIVRLSPSSLFPADISCQRWLINPGAPIPPSATEIHGITDQDVLNCPQFPSLAPLVASTLSGCDLMGYNVRRFDIRILQAEFARARTPWPCADARIIDPFSVFVQREPRDLAGALSFYCQRTPHQDEAHHALDDVAMTIEVLAGQLERYDDLPASIDEMHTYCEARDASWIDQTGKVLWRDGRAVLAVGKHAGVPLQLLAVNERQYLQWMLAKDFPEDTKAIISKALGGIFPQRQSA